MPRIVPYETVLPQMQAQGLRCVYHNSGAFGFADPPGAGNVRGVGWIGPEDPTIRPAARALARQVPPPYERNLTELAARAWREFLPGPAWLMPKSHWAYELDFGSSQWMPDALRKADVDPAVLAPLNNAAAIEFTPDEEERFRGLVGRLS